MTRAVEKPAEKPMLMRLGIAYLRRRSAELPPEDIDIDVHVLDPEELRALRRVEWSMVGRAALAGAFSGLASALAETWAAPLQQPHYLWWQNWSFWAVVVVVTAAATAVEIAFLYWDALYSVHELSRVAGLALFSEEIEDDTSSSTDRLVGDLARAALELPNSPHSPYPVDPHRETAKWRLVFVALLYKFKITVTSFLVKALLRRALGRIAVRVMLVFVGVPVCALWNAIVAFRVVREARLRAMGPSAARDLVARVAPEPAPDSVTKGRSFLWWSAIGASVVRTHDLHPNLLRLMEEFERVLGHAPNAIDDSTAFLEHLAQAAPSEQATALRILGIATGIDGRLGAGERNLIREAQQATGRVPSLAAARKFARRFASGQPIGDDLLASLAD